MTGCFVVLFLFFDSPPSPPGKAASELYLVWEVVLYLDGQAFTTPFKDSS